ncbi:MULTISPECIES: HlyD family type I secretion periplasmic adaptor subunit [Thiorhodovibrio]|uniref:HlyD family type I secretion periplasmic adaptor subunit n=1 Tax=Thiorhodovibrio TaxID=61593 RepID=UPI0019120621|nr:MULTISPECIES: HlyD family type I secretion periplasmic adaptor subunit [Thiorhodovibrio]MBK5969012.1 hemolysin secretion protein D [Thiorhodovibrio winogradskyi]WPL15108.1 Type I secretion system membrane fusion protein PrsE [Thiorhodovibrio litoralis]
MDINVVPRRVEPDEESQVPTNDKPIWIAGLLVLLFGFGAFAVWASVAPIDGAAVAPGVLAVESTRKTVQHFEGGIVDEILVHEGDHVQKGQVLVRLDDTEASAQLEIVRSQYLGLLARLARLTAERDGAETIDFPQELLKERDDPRIAEAIDGEERVFATRRKALQGEKDVLRQRAVQLQEQILGLEAQSETKQKRIDLYQEEIDGLKTLFKKGLGDKSRLREWERMVAELEGERAEHQASIAATRVRISETELQVVQLDRQQNTEVASEMRDVETKLGDLSERQRALTKTLERTEITAPVTGNVVSVNLHTIGGVVRSGEPLLDIVPMDENLIVEAQVNPVDIDRVFPGLNADLRMSAFNARTTPNIPGKVMTVSADSLTDERTGMSYYLARVKVTPEGMEKLAGKTLQPGMPVQVMIITGERTFLEYLMKPITDIFATAFKED